MSLSDFEFSTLQRMVIQATGNQLPSSRRRIIESKIAAFCLKEGYDTSWELFSSLSGGENKALSNQVIESVLNGETTFFRDRRPFQALEETALPALIEARASSRRLVIWSAACSTGQEPYSLAILLAERFPQLDSWNVRILATDVSRRHLKRAKEGRYTQFEVNRGLSAHRLVKYFQQDGRSWVVHPRLRRRVQFYEANLTTDWPAFIPMVDVLLMRNVLIYFDEAVRRRVLMRAHKRLNADGFLMLGSTETPQFLKVPFETVAAPAGALYRPV